MFRRKITHHYTQVPGLQGPPGPKGDPGKTGLEGRDWTHQVATWEPLPDTDLARFLEPAAAHTGDAAVDLQTTHRVVLDQHTTVDAHTGWRVNLQPDTSGEVLSRSGLSGRGIVVANAPGLVDPGYTGEVIVRLHNLSDRRVVLDAGDRVAQFRVVPTVIPLSHVGQAERGDAGLGSTGVSPADRTAGYISMDGVSVPSTPEDDHPWMEKHRPRVPEVDMVNHPPHYEDHPIFPGECWDYTKWLTPAQYAAAKYLWRYAAKGVPVENLRKALWYLGHAEDGFNTPMVVDLRDVPGGGVLYNRLDADLTDAEKYFIQGDVDFPVSDLYAGIAFLHVIRGDIDAARSSTLSALNHLD